MMVTKIRLSDVIRVRSRFTRSVNLERDFETQAVQDGYVITSLARATLLRIAEGLRTRGGTRAWTLTGPYGSGKSAFALYLAGLLSPTGTELRAETQKHLKNEDPELWKEIFDQRRSSSIEPCNLMPVLVTGSRESVKTSVVKAFLRALRAYPTRKSLELAEQFDSYLLKPAASQSDRELLQLIERVAKEVVPAYQQGTGLLIVLDELGKFLEHAALNPASGDLLFLQALAELAHRSTQQIVFVTLLHQSFDRYAERLTALERSEWAKVQGRFEDVAFQESYEQNVRLIAKALERDCQSTSLDSLVQLGRNLCTQAGDLGLRPQGLAEQEFAELLGECAPLHPLVALLLGPLFRKLAQNERSLFAFLGSKEPHGFQEFLHVTEASDQPAFYGLPLLYDYLAESFGANLYASASGSRWAEIETALERLGRSATETDRAMVKCVGMLSLVGNLGNLKPDLDVLAFALNLPRAEAESLLHKLCERSILIFRSFKSSYALWEGSDFDVDAHLREARDQLDRGDTLADLLIQERPIRPLVARRHSIQNGVVRYFDVTYWDIETLSEALPLDYGEADGLVVLLIGGRADEERTQQVLRQVTTQPRLLLGIPEATRVLQGYLEDLRALRHVLQTSPELAGDAVAKRELRTRIQDTQHALQAQMDSLIDQVAQEGQWFHLGRSVPIQSRRHLTETLSEICDHVFSKTPIVRNEMIHRRVVSSACSAARNNLIESMLKRGYLPHLGIEGHPLERSLYDALLGGPGIHRQENGSWGFHAPTPGHPDRIAGIWEAFWNRLDVGELDRTPVGALFQSVIEAPLGMKEGPLPILLCAFLLAHETELAMYEEGAFIPHMSPAHYERLVRNPDRFQIQRYRVEGVRGQVFASLAAAYSGKPKQERLLTLVRPMFTLVAGLPPYAKVTKWVSNEAVEVRNAILDASDPVRLLFESLPRALGFQPLGAEDVQDDTAQRFVQQLQQNLRDLQNAYPNLLTRMEEQLLSALGAKAKGETGRGDLVARAKRLLTLQLDEKVTGILVRLADEHVDHQAWVESLGTAMVNKPPKHWVDQDEGNFNTALLEFQRRFRQLEALSLEIGGSESQAYCVSILIPGKPPQDRVVRLESGQEAELQRLKAQLLSNCLAPNNKATRETMIMALAEAALHLFQSEPARPQQGEFF